MKIWLDDLRPTPAGWTGVQNFKDAIALIASCQSTNEPFEVISLDHDLGEALTGYDVVKWMAENNIWPINKPLLHTANPVGRVNMAAVIDRYGPY